jgi:hypothetical protein
MTRYFWAIVLGAVTSTSCATAVRDTHLALANNVAATPAAAPVAPGAREQEKGDPLQLDVYPRFTTAQSDAWIRLRVEPDARSRSIELEWFSAEGGGGAHLINLEGERAAVRHQFPIKRLSAGEYEVTAVLTRNDGTRVRRTTTVTVVGPEGFQ